MKKNKNLFVLLLLLAITAVAYGSTFLYVKINNMPADDDDFLIMTSCNPVYISVLNITENAKDVRVENLSQPTTGCLHDYTLTAEDMKNLSHADVLVISGGGMEGYLDDVMAAYPDLTIIDASSGIELLAGETEHEDHEDFENHEDHDEHDEHEDHDHGAFNSHYWMSVSCNVIAVSTIAEGLIEVNNANCDIYADNRDAYITRMVDEITPELSAASAKLGGENIICLHSAYEYISLELGSNVVGLLDLDEERQVSAGEVANLLSEVKKESVAIVFAESDYGKSMGDLIEEQTGVKSVYLNTLIHGQYDKDSYIKVMIDNYSLINQTL